MRRDKASLILPSTDKTLLRHGIDRLSSCCSEVLVAARQPSTMPSGDNGFIQDGPGQGPAAGILGAAQARPNASLLVLACDLPMVPVELLRALMRIPGDWVVPRLPVAGRAVQSRNRSASRRLEPLASLFRPPALRHLRANVGQGNFALHSLLAGTDLRIHFLEESELLHFGDPAEIFLNLNFPADLALAALRQDALRRLYAEG